MTEQPGAPDPRRLRASDADREQVAKILHAAASAGRITLSELEERLDEVYRTKTIGELEPVISDLPEGLRSPGHRSPAVPQGRQAQPWHPSGAADLIGGTPGSTTSIAVMSGTTRNGSWVVPHQHTSIAFCGGVQIDLRNARFAEQHVTITAVAVMAGIEIVVPDDIVVDVTGMGLMGGFELKDRSEAPAAGRDAPVVTVNGMAFWGGVEVVRKPRSEQRPKLEK